MNNSLDFTKKGYQIERELGQNPAGGRVTYLAKQTETEESVVLKQFQFAQSNTTWGDYDAFQRELEVLRSLSFSSIPRYLDSFETPTGFCLVQEYKHAPSLAVPRHFTPLEVKEIAIAILEILVYLQEQNPPVIHRDIKPENILVDRSREIKVYLVDFGFARSCGDVPVSSVIKGTLGFMPPEQLFNHQLTKASDLYSLGATLICLLTGTKSSEIGRLVDNTYRINFKHLVPHLSPAFIRWLTKMTAPNLKHRFADAQEALDALKPINVTRTPFTLSPLNQAILAKLTPPILGFGLFGICAVMSANFKTPEIAQPVSSRTEFSSQKVPLDNQIHQLLKTGECEQCDLEGAELRVASLEGENLFQSNLRKANLQGAKLQGAMLRASNLEAAKLQGVNLRGAYSGEANLERANLEGANLEGANFFLTNLQSANLQGANLEGAELQNANLKNTKLRGAKLQEANLEKANLEAAFLNGVNFDSGKLRKANLFLADLEDANLEDANLEDANLESANLSFSNLESANLKGANLKNASFQGANLEEASLEWANLENVNLIDANLEGANLRNANLENADLRGTNLKEANLKGANLKGALLPNSLRNSEE